MRPYFNNLNWNNIEDRVDKSAWLRLNEIIWEPLHVPVREDKAEFKALPKNIQTTIMNSFASLSALSRLQMQTGLDQIKKDSRTFEEYAVFNALSYLAAIDNKGYCYIMQELGTNEQVNAATKWVANNTALQKQLYRANSVFQSGSALEKKAVNTLFETSLYNANLYIIMYLFGQGKLPRTAEVVKLSLRGTSFASMYPGYKFRLAYKEAPHIQANIRQWIDNYIDDNMELEYQHLHALYDSVDMYDDALHYFRYNVNKALLNLSLDPRFPDDSNSVNQTAMHGLIKSAVFNSFFSYINDNYLNKYKEKKE